jgi:hypothetical protein
MSDFREQGRPRYQGEAGYVTAVTRRQRQTLQTTIRRVATHAQQYFAKQVIDFQHYLGSLWFETRSALNLPKEQSQAEIARAFENAKGLAHFIGMIVNLGFAVALCTFCFKQMKATRGWMDLSAYSVAMVFFLGLSSCLWFWISSIGFRYFWGDVADNRLGWLKVTGLLLLVMEWFAITWAIFKFAGAVVSLIDAS